ncbi:hypothetical protein HNP86_001983 [Methanococcus maripaludis]|uniref:Uncharacterized protein n=1 Tax=Methanococcus maripaludis TaxID=39152 RepID=A0A7J9NX45_METMI|nr:hypothetical protein [Methanococcus maripaludis]MBA2851824.1 hypothetical protein [Methanococcus maripaludis]
MKAVDKFISRFKTVDMFSKVNFFYLAYLFVGIAAYEYYIGNYFEYGGCTFIAGTCMASAVSLTILVLKDE